MDGLGVGNQVMKSSKKQSRRDKKEIKVTYIASPMKVETSASNFRALVQELTGQYSNVAEALVDVHGDVHEKVESQQMRVAVDGRGYMPEAAGSWLKHNYGDFHSRSLMEPLNQHLQFDLLSYDGRF
ncbi:hypothetical protein L6164_017824 [Bauhinia variegata]|uniref:Uncharacterized protein n=1 Tax=Bauhinia variegata TaxID=167791 RepID=A0ACB9NB93_BAUVA|nr:hypothetical protein L6164_017824 [Bauhinia variegata]